MSWLYSQVLVEEFSGDISWDGEPSALWNGTPTQHPSWCSDRTMARCQLSRSGMTFKPLMDDLGEGVLMSFLEAFPARTSAQPEEEQESMASEAVCGSTWQELLVRFDRDSSSWKTAHCLWEEDLPESSVTLPRWGMMRSGECWEREMPEHLTSGTGSGLLESYPTPNCFDAIPDFGDRQDNNLENGGRHGVSLRHLVKMWPTPTCADLWNPSTMKSAEMEWTQGNLRGIAAAPVKMWPTPTAAEANLSNQANYGQKGLSNHPAIVGKPTRPKEKKSRKGKRQFPTPTASDHFHRRATENWEGSDLVSVVTKSEEEEGRMQPKSGGQLNPNWVEWLMGWPIGWTDLNALATDKCPSVQHWPGES